MSLFPTTFINGYDVNFSVWGYFEIYFQSKLMRNSIVLTMDSARDP